LSCSQCINRRFEWIQVINEILYLGNEAAIRREAKFKTLSQTRGKPLALEYICDRVDTDDPVSGFAVRTEAEGWMQGYITFTTFTIWQKWFRWDSVCGIPPGHPTDEEEVEWLKQRVTDERSKLAAELADQVHDGDPDGEGVIWPHVAEVSLLGALGCGSFLLQLVLTKLEEPGSPYDYCVLQASENAVEFYEKNGFTRVGALARYSTEEDDKTTGKGEEDDEYVPEGAKSKKKKKEAKAKAADSDEKDDEDFTPGAGKKKKQKKTPKTKAKKGKADDEDEDLAMDDDGVPTRRQTRPPRSTKKGDIEYDEGGNDLALDFPPLPKREVHASLNGAADVEAAPDASTADVEAAEAAAGAAARASGAGGDSEHVPRASNPILKHNERAVSSSTCWYCSDANDTCATIAHKFAVRAADILFMNRRSYPAMAEGSRLKARTYLRIPDHKQTSNQHRWIPEVKSSEGVEKPSVPLAVGESRLIAPAPTSAEPSSPPPSKLGELKVVESSVPEPESPTSGSRRNNGRNCKTKAKEKAKMTARIEKEKEPPKPEYKRWAYGKRVAQSPYYCCAENETPKQVATKFNVLCTQLVMMNEVLHDNLRQNSRLMAGTLLRIPGVDPKEDKEWVALSGLGNIVPYRHWTFPDQPVEYMHESYMMCRRLRPRRKGEFKADGPKAFTPKKTEDADGTAPEFSAAFAAVTAAAEAGAAGGGSAAAAAAAAAGAAEDAVDVVGAVTEDVRLDTPEAKEAEAAFAAQAAAAVAMAAEKSANVNAEDAVTTTAAAEEEAEEGGDTATQCSLVVGLGGNKQQQAARLRSQQLLNFYHVEQAHYVWRHRSFVRLRQLHEKGVEQAPPMASPRWEAYYRYQRQKRLQAKAAREEAMEAATAKTLKAAKAKKLHSLRVVLVSRALRSKRSFGPVVATIGEDAHEAMCTRSREAKRIKFQEAKEAKEEEEEEEDGGGGGMGA
jgi:hypothetical protein